MPSIYYGYNPSMSPWAGNMLYPAMHNHKQVTWPRSCHNPLVRPQGRNPDRNNHAIRNKRRPNAHAEMYSVGWLCARTGYRGETR
jgi:hypothetical protein